MRPRSSGVSMLELLVGLAVSLMVVSAGLVAWTQQTHEARQVLIEARLTQDLRTVTHLITDNLRRAGHWAQADHGVWHAGQATMSRNPNQVIAAQTSSIALRYTPADPTLSSEFGYRLHLGAIEMHMGAGAWQAMTDVQSTVITELAITSDLHTVSLPNFCALACTSAHADTCPPRVETRLYALQLSGHAARNPHIKRQTTSQLRIRNDALLGACPT